MNNAIEFLSPPTEYSMADEWHGFADAGHFWMRWRLDALRRMVPDGYEWGEVLDVGCGNGAVRRQIEETYRCRVTACDLSMQALKMVPPGNGPVYYYDVHQRHPSLRQKFSTVLLLDVLEHIADTVGFLDAVRFHLRPGGYLFINVPAHPWLYSAYDEVDGHKRRYTPEQLKKEMKEAGFMGVKTAYWGFSLIPLLAARKVVLRYTPKERVIKKGFEPESPFFERLLQALRRMENAVWPCPPTGTSLIAVARKEKA